MNRDNVTLGPMLASLHQQMRGELDERLLLACSPAAGVWDRWAAVRVVESELRPCLLAERELVHAVSDLVPAAVAEHLWAVGELLHVLGSRLCELGRLAQGGDEFLCTADKFHLAFEYWCGNVEAFISPMHRSKAPEGLVTRLSQMEERAPAMA